MPPEPTVADLRKAVRTERQLSARQVRLFLNHNQTSRALLDEEQLPILPEVARARNDESPEVDGPSIEMVIESLVPVFQTGGGEDYVKVPDCVVCTKIFPIPGYPPGIPRSGHPWCSRECCIFLEWMVNRRRISNCACSESGCRKID